MSDSNKLSILDPPDVVPGINHSGKPCFDFSAISRSPRFDDCIVATEEPEYDDDDNVVNDEVYVVAVGCPNCRFFMPKKHAKLAEIHYGPLTEFRLGSDEWKTLTDC